ncbi:TetR/AcrR family transcriptional regulator [Silvimonas amylolytica]|uniref:TetR family transcriptional regulator n=1 Tax=Silvimonas amylolytica TaxID=449663 RepID=A0ABQ2PGV9_9NEIS|nr:TetR/AcrR family transcriptional regulator [Silvimonas amylolytica]GGP24844.1 TetR family transcriptional regulator [Silvimonas amylolytica]
MATRQARSEQTRRAIVKAALVVLGRDGAARLTFGAVAREAGLSKGAVTRHFPSKKDLLQGILAFRAETFRALRNDFVATQPSDAAPQFIVGQIAMMRAMVENAQSPARAIFSALLDAPEAMQEMGQRIASSLVKAQAETVDPDLAHLRWAAGWGLGLLSVFGLSPFSEDERNQLFNKLGNSDLWRPLEKPAETK